MDRRAFRLKMKSNLPKRKKNRLENFDYGAGYSYFITICTNNRDKILSSIVGEGSSFVGWFKYQATKQINDLMDKKGTKLFQRSYYDHVIRNRSDYDQVAKYIWENPINWENDELYKED